MASVIANEFTEATEPFHLAVAVRGRVWLLIIALIVNVAGKLVIRRNPRGSRLMAAPPRAPDAFGLAAGTAAHDPPARHEPGHEGLLAVVMAATLAVLAWVLIYVAAQGLQYLSRQFLTQTPPGNPALPGGGFADGIAGGLIIVGIAAVISVPLGIAAAVEPSSTAADSPAGQFCHRRAQRHSQHRHRRLHLHDLGDQVRVLGSSRIVRAGPGHAAADRPGHRGDAPAGACVLREASAALGVTRARTTLSVVLPSATARHRGRCRRSGTMRTDRSRPERAISPCYITVRLTLAISS